MIASMLPGRADGWRAQRLLVRDDGLGFSLSETTVEAGRRTEADGRGEG